MTRLAQPNDRHIRLERLLAERGRVLLGTAVLLTGGHQAGEDLLQQALERVLRHWHRIEGDPEGYLRRTMYNLATDRWRRLGRRREVLAELPVTAVPDDAERIDLRDALVRALALLPSRQRAVLVLRYFEQRTEAEIAATLGCSTGAVKSAASRALAQLRELVGPDLRTSVPEGRQT
ncbi:MAG TPA: SigE family RNA polymerase sigma factor [Mycobacteriales bacterium]|nr:SigE family RNA polymerase sigma factor [Mycobacteriales bacterium]